MITMATDLDLANFASDIVLRATPDSLVIKHLKGNNLLEPATWLTAENITPLGTLFFQRIQPLIEQEIISVSENNLVITYDNLNVLLRPPIEFDLLSTLVPWAPFSISISANGYAGSPHFSLQYLFILGRNHSFPQRIGPFLKRDRVIYRLSPNTFRLLEVIDAFNLLPENKKTKQEALTVLEKVKALTNNSGLDDYLNKETIVLPNKVKLDVEFEKNGLISLVPSFEGVPSDAMKREFLRFSEVQSIYDLEGENYNRLRVIISDPIKDILRDIQKIRHVGGSTKDRVLADIFSCLSDGLNRDLIDLTIFGPRVKGIGEIPLRAKIIIQGKSRDWADFENISQTSNLFKIEATNTDNESHLLHFSSVQEISDLADAVREAKDGKRATVEFKGNKLLIDETLTDGLQEIESMLQPASKDKVDDIRNKVRNSRCLLIYTNEETSEYLEGNQSVPLVNLLQHPIVPKSLKGTIVRNGNKEKLVLKQHQLDGIKWLQNLFRNREFRRGCLLADDMGLGKTLQILAFLAWCIEEGYYQGLGQESGPYEPILIVAPLILLQNWKDEMDLYFSDDIFEPILLLHDKTLKTLIKKGSVGKEVVLGTSRLDIDRIREHRIVITNYDTVKNYQHSFGRIPWSIIVTDEAQEFKDQNARSDALKSLKALFKIVATGTPVENRLLDLWNLLDYMQPGSLVGSSKDFSGLYEKKIEEKSDAERLALSTQLRRILFYGKPDTFILRREKKDELPDLPKKHEERLECDLSGSQRQLHLDLVQNLLSTNKAHHFLIIHTLRRLYLHPHLLDDQKPIDNPQTLIEASPKLQRLIEILTRIKKRKEKVLIFAVLQDMQTILTQVLGSYFGLEIDVINGAPDSSRRDQMNYRKELIDKFSQKIGFNILVLSPRVAGVGLTITEANHVIHYERWWNPAKESQATDRAYRIGQKRDVYVYYLIAKDNRSEFESFDQKLDQLLAEKKRLLKDFLVPTNKAEISYEDMAKSVTQSSEGKASHTTSTQEQRELYDSLIKIRTLDGHNFECLLAVLFKKRGFSVILGPLSRDGGADIIAVSKAEIILIQCKHTTTDIPISHVVIADLQDAAGYYRSKVFSDRMRKLRIQLLGITNGQFDQETKALAVREGINLNETIDINSLIQTFPISRIEMLQISQGRARNMDEVKQRLAMIEI